MQSMEKILNEKWVPITLPWEKYPIGTKAQAIMGGHWIKNKRGWKWHCGATFPTPGADASRVCIPEGIPQEKAPVAKSVKRRMADTMRIYRKDWVCSDCGKSPVIYVHWGPLTEGEIKRLCGSCMKKRVKNQNEKG